MKAIPIAVVALSSKTLWPALQSLPKLELPSKHPRRALVLGLHLIYFHNAASHEIEAQEKVFAAVQLLPQNFLISCRVLLLDKQALALHKEYLRAAWAFLSPFSIHLFCQTDSFLDGSLSIRLGSSNCPFTKTVCKYTHIHMAKDLTRNFSEASLTTFVFQGGVWDFDGMVLFSWQDNDFCSRNQGSRRPYHDNWLSNVWATSLGHSVW